jgi:hypothetical protein
MIFSVQRFLEDYFQQRGLTDVDQYAIRIANLFDRYHVQDGSETFTLALRKIRTAFYRRNQQLNRRDFEAVITTLLTRRFKKKINEEQIANFKQGIVRVRRSLRGKRRSIKVLLREFKNVVEARALDSFWISRKKGKLQHRPEAIAQALLTTFASAIVNGKGIVLREFLSGVGFVDVGVVFYGTLHLIELKLLKGANFSGASQLAHYMQAENRNKGWLVLIDTTLKRPKNVVPSVIETPAGTITTIVICINPPAPSD